MEPSSIVESFSQHFSIRLADTPALRDEVYRIRYQVYCQEFGYEPAENFPDGKESDEFDAMSRHCLVVHKASGRAAGCVRLVETDPLESSAPLPFEKNCGDSLDRNEVARWNLPRRNVCEISRLAVARAFRARAGESETRYGAVSQPEVTDSERRVFPYVAISLYLAATVLTELTDRRNVFAMMEPFLPRLLNRVGIRFRQVGKVIQYHGNRAAYFITTDSALNGMKPELRHLYRIAWDSLSPDSETPTR